MRYFPNYYSDGEKYSGTFNYRIFQIKHGYLEGFWETEKYFIDIRDILLKEIQFPKIYGKNKEFSNYIKNSNSVSIHFRRGDYIKESETYGNICTNEYYYRAISYIKKFIPNPIFFAFSDDITWVYEFCSNIDNIYIVDCNYDRTGYIDLYLMSLCKHNIIANSTFSWWGSWLGKNRSKMVIAPKIWMNGRKMPDISCRNWVRL